jgi:hypothetical protein
MKYLQVKLAADQPPIDNPNYLDCLTPEEMVTTQMVLEVLGIDYDRTGLKENDKTIIRYYTDTNLTDDHRKEIERYKKELLENLQKDDSANLANFVEQAKKAFEGVAAIA